MPITDKEIEKQEHLTEDRLQILKGPNKSIVDWISNRPTQNLVDLTKWVRDNVAILEKSKNIDYEICLHNKIVMDGSFFQFAKENNVLISTAVRDALASWNTDNNFENFIAQGVFKIKWDDHYFYHAALMHKGNQNEDEVSFFVIARYEDIHHYISLRNKYEKWLVARDRDNLEIHVIGGDSQQYEKDLSWDDLYLPDALKKDIKDSIDAFLHSKELYEKNKIAWKKGCFLYGPPGNGKSTLIKVLMSEYNLKPVTVLASSQTNDEMLTEAFDYAQEQSPGLLYLEDLDTMLAGGYITMSHLLNLMDGVSSKNGIIVIATANNPDLLGEALMDRPSRFDRKWEIPLPNVEQAIKYLNKWFGKLLKAKEYKELAESCVEHHFSYAYLKELYITAAFGSISLSRKKLSKKDVDKSLERLLKDKKIVENDFEPESEVGIF